MKKLFLSLAILVLPLISQSAFAGLGDFQPPRSGITLDSHPNGTPDIQFNRFTDSVLMSFLLGRCPSVREVCERAHNVSQCSFSQFKNALTPQETSDCFGASHADERDFVKARRIANNGIYENTVSTPLQKGDKVRVAIYVHNNAKQCDYDDTTCLQDNTARNTKTTINWSNPQELKGSVFASNANPNTVNDFVSLRYASNDLALKVLDNSVYRYGATGNDMYSVQPVSTSDTSHSYVLDESVDDWNDYTSGDDFKSSYLHSKVLYVDFEVIDAVRDATITKDSVPPSETTVERNSTIDYTVTIKNTGNAPLKNTVVTDVLDLNLDYVSAVPNDKYTFEHNNGVITVTLKEDFLPNEEIPITFTVKVKNSTPSGYIIKNKATLKADDLPEKMSPEVIHPVAEGEISVEKNVFTDFDSNEPLTGPLTLGDIFVYRVTVSNKTALDVFGKIMLDDPLPAEVEFVELDPDNSPQGTFDNGTVSFVFGQENEVSLPANTEKSFQFKVKVISIPNTTETGQGDGDCKIQGIQTGILNEVLLNRNYTKVDDDDVCVEVVSLDSVKKAYDKNFGAEITKIGLGETYGYEIAITNNNTTDLTADFVVTDKLPAELDFVNFANHASDDGHNYNVTNTGPDANRVATFTFSELKANDTIRLRMLVKAREIPTNGQIGNVCNNPLRYNNLAWVKVFKTGQPQNNDNKIYQEDLCHPLIPETKEEILLNKSVFIDYNENPIPGPLSIGDEFVYQISVKNNGTQDVTGVITLVDNLPPEVEFVEFDSNNSPQGVHDNRVVTIEFGQVGQPSLPAGETKKFQFKVKVIAFPDDSIFIYNKQCTGHERGKITNEVRLSRDFVFEDDACVVVKVKKPTIVKKAFNTDYTEEKTELSIGETYAYELQIINPNDGDIAKPFTIKDTLPNEVSFLGFDPHVSEQGHTYDVTTQQVNDQQLMWTFHTLKGNDTLKLRMRVKLNAYPQTSPNHSKCPGTQPGIVKNRGWLIVYGEDNQTVVHSEDVCNALPVPGSYTMDKQAFNLEGNEIPDNETLQYGQEYNYKITVVNTGSQNLTNLIVTDELPPEVSFKTFVDPTNGTYNNQTHTLTYEPRGLAVGQTHTFTFTVEVKAKTEIPSATTIINNATADVTELDPIHDNTTHKLPNTGCTNPNGCGGGGGSPPTTPTIGRCNVHPNGALSCQKVTPVKTSPGYQEVYIDCLKAKTGTTTELAAKQQATRDQQDLCVEAWAVDLGYRSCDPDSTHLTTPSIADQCDTPLIPEEPGTCNVNLSASIKKSVWDDAKGTSGEWDDEKTCVPQGTTTKYKVEVYVPKPTDIASLSDATVSIDDFTIPYTSGWTWNRRAVSNVQLDTGVATHTLTVNNIQWDGKPTGGMRLSHDLTSAERSRLARSGMTFTFTYDVDTTLAVDADICQLDNVAKANLTTRGIASDGSSVNAIQGIGHDACEKITVGNISTLGDKARVCIARPFIQARGGSNIGVNLSTDKEKVFGSDFEAELKNLNPNLLIPSLKPNNLNTGGSSSELLTTDKNAYGGTALVNFDGLDAVVSRGDQDKYFAQLKLNALSGQTLPFGTKTGLKSQVDDTYFVSGGLTLSGTSPINTPTTVVIESGDLIISRDFINNGTGTVAFIVRNGDIYIHKDVEQLDGIFLSDGGKIIGEGGDSDIQLQVNGGLMGNARDLLEKRIYIGTNPVQTLEPAVIVRFDLRLLDSTPPGLELFFGQNWTEQ